MQESRKTGKEGCRKVDLRERRFSGMEEWRKEGCRKKGSRNWGIQKQHAEEVRTKGINVLIVLKVSIDIRKFTQHQFHCRKWFEVARDFSLEIITVSCFCSTVFAFSFSFANTVYYLLLALHFDSGTLYHRVSAGMNCSFNYIHIYINSVT